MAAPLKNISFLLASVQTNQFAIIEENYTEGEPVRFGYNCEFATNRDHRLVLAKADIVFEQEKKGAFIKLESTCYFQVEENNWKESFNTETDKYEFTKNFIIHLAGISFGTARGILHSKTEATPFSNFLLPLVDVTSLIKDDVVSL